MPGSVPTAAGLAAAWAGKSSPAIKAAAEELGELGQRIKPEGVASRTIYVDRKGTAFVGKLPPEAGAKSIIVDQHANALKGDLSSTATLTAPENALAHWERHGHEFPQFKNVDEYVQAAQNFVRNPPAGTLTKTRTNGDTLFYDPYSNTFAVRNAEAAPRTMFKPLRGVAYFNRQ